MCYTETGKCDIAFFCMINIRKEVLTLKYRTLALMLAAAMALTLFTGCGKEDVSEEVSSEESSQSVVETSEGEEQSEPASTPEEVETSNTEEPASQIDGGGQTPIEGEAITLPDGFEEHHFYSYQTTSKTTVNGQSNVTVFVVVEDSDTKAVSNYDVASLAKKVAANLEGDTYRFNFYPQGTASNTTSEPFAVIEMDANGNMTLVFYTAL